MAEFQGEMKEIDIFIGKEYSYFAILISQEARETSMNKLTEAEIAWLMSVLTPGDCQSCIWREKEEEKYWCFPSGDSPCKAFADKVFQGLERAELI